MNATSNIGQGRAILNRLDRIPIWPFSQLIIAVTGIGFFFAFFDILSIAMALPVIAIQMHVPMDKALLTITSSLIGYIIGSFIDSRIADVFGRRIALFLSITFFSIGSLMTAASHSIDSLIFWRFIIGMGIGAEIANVATYIGELSPAACRGRVSSLALSYGFFGFAVIPFVALLLVPHFSWGWRALFVIGGVGGVITAILRRYVPNSIRWYVAQGRFAEAEEVLKSAEAYAVRKLKTQLPQPTDDASITKLSSGSFTNLFKPPYLQRVVYFAVLWFVYYLGNYGWLTLSDQLLLQVGYTFSNSLLFVSIASLGFVFGAVVVIFMGDKVERKWSSAAIALLWTAILLLIGYFPTPTMIMVGGFIATTTIAMLVPLMYTLTAEHFPTSFRTTGVSITDGVGHLGGAFCGQIILGIAAFFTARHLSFQAAFTTMATSGLITTLLLLAAQKMTKKSLQQ